MLCVVCCVCLDKNNKNSNGKRIEYNKLETAVSKHSVTDREKGKKKKKKREKERKREKKKK